MVTIRVIVLKTSRKAGVALIAALLLTLHGLVLCAAGVPDCADVAPTLSPAGSSVCTPIHREEGCHHHQHNGSPQSHCCVCCESILCDPHTELTRPETRTTIERTMFIALSIVTLPSNSAVINLPGTSEPPSLHSPRRVFLIQRTLLI